jgi:hypothetical protein
MYVMRLFMKKVKTIIPTKANVNVFVVYCCCCCCCCCCRLLVLSINKNYPLHDNTRTTKAFGLGYIYMYVKVKQSLYRPGQALGLQEVEDPRISRQSVHEDGKVVSPTHRPHLPSPPRRR